MFVHNLKYALKTLFRNRMLIFWTYAFPIILGTLFYMAFSDIESSEKLAIIDIAVVDNESFKDNEFLKEGIEQLSKKGDEQLFSTKYVSEQKAKELLEADDITGYILADGDKINVNVATNGINETILKYAVDEMLQTGKVVSDVAETEFMKQVLSGQHIEVNQEAIYKYAVELSGDYEINIKDTSRTHLSYTMIEFYTLIAMACLYGGLLGMVAMNRNLPNMAHIGKRVGVSPVGKGKMILSSVLAGYIVQIIGIAILFVYTVFVLKVDYGDKLLQIILLALIGALSGLSLGVAVGAMLNVSENAKTGIVIAITMLFCYLSGMMGITMKYIVDTYASILNKINPAAMITDGFYALYYYDTLGRYWTDIISLIIFSVIMIGLAYGGLRRRTYDSI